jgi:hypothetical protein
MVSHNLNLELSQMSFQALRLSFPACRQAGELVPACPPAILLGGLPTSREGGQVRILKFLTACLPKPRRRQGLTRSTGFFLKKPNHRAHRTRRPAYRQGILGYAFC